MMRVGFGYDSHRLVAGRRLMLGGVEIPFEKGSLGHSDGDALLHAIIDAIIGAMGMGDIGKFFPDTNPRYKDIASGLLLAEIVSRIHEKGFTIGNIDASVILEKPHLASFIDAMRKSIAAMTKTNEERVSIKAKTNEGMGFIGNGEGVAVFAVVTLFQKKEAR